MPSQVFISRKHELARLQALHNSRPQSLVVLKGRLRVGKSRLMIEFATQNPQHKLWNFAGLVPKVRMNAQEQRDHFAKQFASLLKISPPTFQNWSSAFEHLGRNLRPRDIILLDEISWIGAQDASFITRLKFWWDRLAVPVMMVLCSSVPNWIEENMLKGKTPFGTANLTITLNPLTIPESNALLKASGFQGSAYDTYKLLSIFGGTPLYLEQASPSMTANAIIRQLCLEKDGLLVAEFDRILHDMFNDMGDICKKILEVLKDGMRALPQLREAVRLKDRDKVDGLLDLLIKVGFVKKQQLWSLKAKKGLKQILYRICDPYIRFYLKFIISQKYKIYSNSFQNAKRLHLPNFELQTKLLLLQNRALLLKAMSISWGDIVAEGPFWQAKSATQSECQIDYLVQTFSGNLFVGEFRFEKRELGMDVITEMKEKVDALKVPKGLTAIPILFHVGGVSPYVAFDGYFYRVINIADFLEDIE